MCRHTPSPAPPVIEEHGEAIGRLRGPPRELEVARVPSRSANLNGFSNVRHNPRYRRITVEHSERMPLPHQPKVLAQTSLQIGNPNIGHDQL